MHSDKLIPWTCRFEMYGGFSSCDKAGLGEGMQQHTTAFSEIVNQVGGSSQIAIVGIESDVAEWKLDKKPVRLPVNPYGTEKIIPLPNDAQPMFCTIPDKQADSLSWRYGDGLTGRGLSKYVLNPYGVWEQVGNIIAVRDKNDSTTGIDFGGGLETTLRSLHGGKSNHEWSNLYERFGLQQPDTLNVDLANLLNACETLLILADNKESFENDLSVVQRDFEHGVRAISILSCRTGISQTKLASLLQNYSEQSGLRVEAYDVVMSSVNQRRQVVDSLVQFALNEKQVQKHLQARHIQANRQQHHFSSAQKARVLYRELSASGKLPWGTNILPGEIERAIKNITI
jgi:hypothetical protein